MALVPTIGLSQSITSGSVTGLVTTENAEPVGAALLYLRDEAGGRTYVSETNNDGVFGFSLLPPGEYSLIAEQLGYRPINIDGILITAGALARVAVVLMEAEPPVATIDSVPFVGGSVAAQPGVERTIPAAGLRRTSWNDRTLFEIARLVTPSDAPTAYEGLNEAPLRLAIDGTPLGITRHPVLPQTVLLAGAVPTLGFTQASVLSAPTDLEWGGFASGVINGIPRRGTSDFSIGVFGDWAGSPGASSANFDPTTLSHSSVRAGGVVSGSIVPDTLQFVLGGEYQKLQTPFPTAWVATPGDVALVSVAADSFGVDLTPYVETRIRERTVTTGFVRFDSQLERHGIYLWSSFTQFEESEPFTGQLGVLGLGTRVKGTDITGGLSAASRLSRVFRNELRLGFASTSRDFNDNSITSTWVGGAGVRFGTDAGQPGDFRRTHFSVNDALHVNFGVIRFKLGGGIAVASHDLTTEYGAVGEYTFTDPDYYGREEGAVMVATGSPLPARWSKPQYTGLLQMMWSASPRVDLTFGVRWDGESLPDEKVIPNPEWEALTGLANGSLPGFLNKWSPRIGFRWRYGAHDDWVVQGNGGIYYDEVDPGVLAELISESGRITIRRGIGDVSGWVDPSVRLAGQQVGARLALLGPNYQAPRSSKFSIGLARRIGTRGVIEIAGNYRHTEFLARRQDLNLLNGRVGMDQYGRPIYGDLSKSGSVLAPEPGTNRRFPGFELVSALNADGKSDYWGVTTRLDIPVGRFLSLLASYTYSQTKDNLLSGIQAGPYEELTPFPDSLGGRDWANGLSTFDVPHRVAIVAELQPLGRPGLSIAALFRYQSGRPFTPGFRYGVDINGDGSSGNDPAFVDDGILGIPEILARWPCLRDQIGGFAERNACRQPGTSSLDLRVGFGPIPVGSYPVEFWVEALNVTETDAGIHDNALYVVDPNTPLTKDPQTGEVTVPLLANGNFGNPVAFRGPGRSLRFGLRVNY